MLRPGGGPPIAAVARSVLAGAALLWLALAPAATARADAVHVASEYEVKAAYLYQFSRFATWPDSALRDGAIVIGIAGDDPFGPVIDRLLAGKKSQGRPLTLVRLRSAGEAARCHLVFVDDSDPKLAREVLAAAAGHPVLTVGESERFAEAGGMIRLKSVGGRVRFDVREDVASEHGIRMTSDLLRAADHVQRRAR